MSLEEDLVDILSEAARDSSVKQAQSDSEALGDASGGIARIAEGKTPSDEVIALLYGQNDKTAAQEIAEHRVRKQLHKLASRNHRLVDDFLTAAEGD